MLNDVSNGVDAEVSKHEIKMLEIMKKNPKAKVKEIADDLGKSCSTVDRHIKN